MLKRSVLVAFSALLFVVGQARADTIVYSQAANKWGPYASQNDTTYGNFATVYDNFTLSSNTSITDVHWIGAYFYGPPDPDFLGSAAPGTITGFTLKFWSDVIDSGTGLDRPQIEAAPILTVTVSGNAGETDLGYGDIYVASGPNFTGIGPNEMYSYGINLATPFTATGGTNYWLSIVADSTYPPEWGWETAGVVGAGLSYRGTTTLVQNISGGDFAFSLSSPSPVPEPASLALLGIGLAALGFSRRRRS